MQRPTFVAARTVTKFPSSAWMILVNAIENIKDAPKFWLRVSLITSKIKSFQSNIFNHPFSTKSIKPSILCQSWKKNFKSESKKILLITDSHKKTTNFWLLLIHKKLSENKCINSFRMPFFRKIFFLKKNHSMKPLVNCGNMSMLKSQPSQCIFSAFCRQSRKINSS